jgi:thiol-disulfide isomerase/thioredoxin
MEAGFMGRKNVFSYLILFVLLSLFPHFCLGSGFSERGDTSLGTVRMVLFYSGKSEQGISEDLLPALREVYSIDVRLYDVDVPRNSFLLMALEEQYGKKGSDLPVIFVGEDVISGEEEIWETLGSTIARYEALGGCEFPPFPDTVKEVPTLLKYPVYLAYFYEQGCPKCERVGSLIEHLRGSYRGLVVREIDIETPEAQILNESLCEQMDVPEAKRLTAPSIFSARDALVGEDITVSALEGLIHKYGTMPQMDPPWRMAEIEKNRAEQRIIERFKTLGISAVAAAGFIDGVNPCAFATLIFFVSYLTFVGRARREILLVGLTFSLSVFVTYFLVGLGLLRVIQSVSVVPAVSRYIYLATIGLALGLGALSLYDYTLCRRGRSSDMVLQMPAFLKNQVRGIIRKEVWWNRYILAAIATGFVVSILELTCTGQVYLPTILFVSRFQGLKANALGYLALYNLMFVIPLLCVFALVFFGTGSERLSFIFQRHVGRVKFATSLVFFVLAGVLALSLL